MNFPTLLRFTSATNDEEWKAQLSYAASIGIALLAWFALYGKIDATIDNFVADGKTVGAALLRCTSYMTNLTTLIIAVYFSASVVLKRRGSARFESPRINTTVTAYALFVLLVYNLLLRETHPTMFRMLINELTHVFIPLFLLAYWLVFVPGFRPDFRYLAISLVYPLTFALITLWRGSASGFYPYGFINVLSLGYPRVLVTIGLLILTFVLLIVALCLLNHWIKRPQKVLS